jgi:sortase A
MGTTDPRPWRFAPRKLGAAIAALAVCAGAGGWALTSGDSPDRSGERDNPVPAASAEAAGASTTSAPTTVGSSTTTAAPVQLPVPERAPEDPRAPTPEVIHGTLELPTIGVEQPLHEGVTLTAIDRGPSHWPGTAMPGEVGNVVVAGHRVTHTRPFYDMDLLQPGDPLVFRMNDGTTWTYELVRTEIVAPNAMEIVNQTPERTATLFACHPKHSAAQRIVGHFRLASPSGSSS